MEHGIYTPEELTDDYAARWDRMALPYDEAISQEEQRLYRGLIDHEPMVPLAAFVIVALICLATIAALVLP